jgi:hypothetical protein
MINRILAAGLLSLSVTACATSYPQREVTQGGSEATLAFSDAPEGAMVFLNRQPVGEATMFDGVEGVLEVPPGRHLVSVMLGNATLYEQEVYVGRNATLTIDVR